MHGEPVTIRTIDPPLHEFLPKREELMVEIAEARGAGQERRQLDGKLALLQQGRAAARVQPDARPPRRPPRHHLSRKSPRCRRARSSKRPASWPRKGVKVVPEIMIPLVGLVKELRDQKAVVDRVAAEVMKEKGVKVKYLVGTMIEVPRGALTADQIAAEARVLLLRDERSDAAGVRFLARRHRQVPARLSGQEDPRQGPVCHLRQRGRRTAGAHSRGARTKDAARTSSWASAASTAATRRRSTSSNRSGWTTSAARRTACRSRGLPPPRRRSRSRWATEDCEAVEFGSTA